jgi:hypothetical protein
MSLNHRNVSGISHLPPRVTGIGHGTVYRPCQKISDDDEQFASNELVGSFIVYGVSMNSMTIYDSPYGNVEVEWDDAHGGKEVAVLPVLERDDVQGSYFVVGVVKDPRYSPANFRFNKISYNDFAINDVVSGDLSTIKACPYTDGSCAPLAPYEAYDVRIRSPFLTGYYNPCGTRPTKR